MMMEYAESVAVVETQSRSGCCVVPVTVVPGTSVVTVAPDTPGVVGGEVL